MAMSRLFVADAVLHLKNKGFLKPRRWFSSATSPPSSSSSSSTKKVSKKTEAAKEKKAEAVKSFIHRYMLTHPGVFPKAKEVHEKVGGSWYVLKDILTEMKTNMLLNSQIDKQIIAEATSKAIVMEENMDSGKLDRREKGFVLLAEMLDVEKSHATEVKDSGGLSLVKISDNAELPEPTQTELSTGMLDVEKSHTTEVNDSEDLSLVKVSDNAEIPEPKQTEQSVEDLTYSATVSGQQLSDSTGHIVEKEESTRASISDMHSSEVKLTEAILCGNRDANCRAPNQNFPATEIAASEKKVINLFDFFKKGTGKGKELNGTKINSSKHETCSDLKEDNRHVISLVDVFKRNQKDSGDDNLIHEKKLEQDGAPNPKVACGEDSERSNVKGLLDQIIELSKDTRKPGSWANVPSNKTNRVNGELRSFVNESMKLLSLNEEDTSGCQLDRTEVGKAEVQTESNIPTAASILNLIVKNDRGQRKEPISCEVDRGVFQLYKNEKAMEMSEESDSDVAAFDYPKPEPSHEIPPLFQGPNLNASPNEQMGSHKNLLLVKFLIKTAKVNDIGLAFSDCGPISEIRIVNSRRENRFNYAYVCFKTEEGLRKALHKNDMAICGADVVVEPTSPFKACNKMFFVEPVKDVDFPIALLKNPSRTVMIKGLPDNLSFHHLRHALLSCGRVSSIAMGSSASNVYVEFKSEETKERALAEATVSVSGSKLSILRVDAPKTTVVRISNVKPGSGVAKIRSICDSYGRVKRLVCRDVSTFDVHFALSEWTNMLKILNRLNGLVVDQHQWIAQPATVIPAEVLQSLWNKPEGRKQVYEMIQSICRRIEENSIDTASMLGLAQDYYRDS